MRKIQCLGATCLDYTPRERLMKKIGCEKTDVIRFLSEHKGTPKGNIYHERDRKVFLLWILGVWDDGVEYTPLSYTDIGEAMPDFGFDKISKDRTRQIICRFLREIKKESGNDTREF